MVDHLTVIQQQPLPPPSASQPPMSRFRKGATSFGPVGRISWTLFVVLLPVFVAVFGGFGGLIFLAGWGGIIAPMALRDLWKKDRPYVQRQVVAPVPQTQLRTGDTAGMLSLGAYVAQQSQGMAIPPPPPTPPSFF
jgi:hypothetical protein